MQLDVFPPCTPEPISCQLLSHKYRVYEPLSYDFMITIVVSCLKDGILEPSFLLYDSYILYVLY